MHGVKEEFTFFRPGCSASRLDRFYVPESLEMNIEDVHHIPSLSDHSGVKLKMKLDYVKLLGNKNSAQTYWKLNTAILNEEDFLPSFKIFWNSILQLSPLSNDIADWWDNVAKPNIKQFCIQFSIQRKQRRTAHKQFLLSSLKLFLEDNNWEQVARIKESLNQILNEDLMGFVVRSRFGQNLEEERASLFHAGREVKNKKNCVTSLKVNGVIEKDPLVIETEVTRYFTALFNGHHNSHLVNTGVPFVSDATNLPRFLENLTAMDEMDRDRLEEDIDIDELDVIIKECANNKAPGLDGLCYEFFKFTWPIIRVPFTMVLQCQLDRQRLILSDKMGATRLLSKVTGVPRVDELRPITLLNCDYRILTKLFVSRVKPVLPTIIRSGQLCTAGKKNILSGVRNILSSIFYANSTKKGACLISLDFYKAYDRVLISFLIVVMKHMGFGDTFCAWVQMLHTDAETTFLLSRLSESIPISFSIRQGDPFAMLLYIIYAEPLLTLIESGINGMMVKNIQ